MKLSSLGKKGGKGKGKPAKKGTSGKSRNEEEDAFAMMPEEAFHFDDDDDHMSDDGDGAMRGARGGRTDDDGDLDDLVDDDIDLDDFSTFGGDDDESGKSGLKGLFKRTRDEFTVDDADDHYYDVRDGGGESRGRTLIMGLAALLLSGGLVALWLVLSSDSDRGPTMTPDRGDDASGPVVVQPMPRAPGTGLFQPPGAAGATDSARQDSAATVDDTTRSIERRPWLTGDATESGAPDAGQEPGQATLPGQATAPGQAATPGQDQATTPGQATLPRQPTASGQASAPGPSASTSDMPVTTGAGDAGNASTAEAPPTAGPLARLPQQPAQADDAASGGTPPAETPPPVVTVDVETAFNRPRGEILPTSPVVAMPDIPPYPVEEGYRPGRMPRFADLPPVGSFQATPLPDAPLTDLLRPSEHGLLPVIAQDGRVPWRTYARPFSGDPALPRVAIIVTGLGMREPATQAAIAQLPSDVTLAFDPYAENLGVWIGRARQAGHEVLLEMPVEPPNFPSTDPGPLAMMSLLSDLENRTRLHSVLGRAGGYVGLLAESAGRFTDDPQRLRLLLEEVRTRGLLYVHRGAPVAVNGNNDILPPVNQVGATLDETPFQRAIDTRLEYLEALAREQGYAIGVVSATPVGLYRVSRWIQTLAGKNLALGPASSVMLSPDSGNERR